MKGNAIYVNVGRGSTTDQEALIEALGETAKEGEEEEATGTLRIGAAALECVPTLLFPLVHPSPPPPPSLLTATPVPKFFSPLFSSFGLPSLLIAAWSPPSLSRPHPHFGPSTTPSSPCTGAAPQHSITDEHSSSSWRTFDG